MTGEERTGLQPLQVLGGLVLGWFGSWFLYALSIVTGLAYYDQATVGGVVASLVSLFVIPVAAGVVLFRRGRTGLGTGLLLGVAVGSVVGAGVCTGTWVVPSV